MIEEVHTVFFALRRGGPQADRVLWVGNRKNHNWFVVGLGFELRDSVRNWLVLVGTALTLLTWESGLASKSLTTSWWLTPGVACIKWLWLGDGTFATTFARSHEPAIHTCSFSLVPMFAHFGLGSVLRLVLLVVLPQLLYFCTLHPSWHFCIFILFKSNLIQCSSQSSAKLPRWPHHIFNMCGQRSGRTRISPRNHAGRDFDKESINTGQDQQSSIQCYICCTVGWAGWRFEESWTGIAEVCIKSERIGWQVWLYI